LSSSLFPFTIYFFHIIQHFKLSMKIFNTFSSHHLTRSLLKCMSVFALVFLMTQADAQTTYYSKAAATDFNNVASWGTVADGSGAAPASISNADNFIIQNASAMTLSAAAAVRALTITTGSLTVGGNTLTVSRSAGNLSTLLINGGTLNLSTPSAIVLNGNFSMSSGALNQSGGSITIDGNDNNNAATSVPSATHHFSVTGGLPNCTDGTIVMVDPPVSSYGLSGTRSISMGFTAGSTYFTNNHTFIIGDGISTTVGNTDGFTIETYASGAVYLNNVTVNSGNAVGRWGCGSFGLTTGWGTFMRGTLTINAGSEFRVNQTITSANSFSVLNIVNNGTFTTGRTSGIPNIHIGAFTSGFTPTTASSVTGTGVFRNLAASPTAPFTSVVFNNPLGIDFAAGTLALGAYTGHVLTTLTMISGSVNTNGQPFVLGTSITNLGSLTYTAGGFASASPFSRWIAATTAGTTIAASTIPTASTGTFPFQVGVFSRNFHISRPTTTGAVGGVITVTHNNVAGLNTITTVADGAYNITRQAASNWTVATSNSFAAGTGTFAYAVSGEALFASTTANNRLMLAASVVGTHQAGTALPHAQRTAITAAAFANTWYLGVLDTELPITAIASGAIETGSNWSNGTGPVCGSLAVIPGGISMTANAAAVLAGSLQINNGATLTVSGNSLTVGCAGNNSTLTVGGTLVVSGGTLNVNGNIVTNAGSTFTQSGGDIIVNGNSGTVGTSVLTATPIINLQSNLLNLTGGKLTIVTGHIGTAGTDRVIAYSGSSTLYPNVTTGHTVQFGNGTNTTANSTKGFEILTGSRLYFGNVIMNSVSSANAFFATGSTGSTIINGDLTITNGDFRVVTGIIQYIGGNILNNGILTTIGTMYFGQVTQANLATPTITPQTVGQSVSGSGVFRNATTGQTANFASITINNTSATGVTFANANSLLSSGGVTGTASSTLTFTNGVINTNGTNPFILGVSAALGGGTLSVTAGGFATGSNFSRWWGTATSGATISASTTPTSTTGAYPFVTGVAGSYSARNMYLNQTVAATTGGKINVNFVETAGTSTAAITDGAYTVDLKSNGAWAVSQTGITGPSTYSMAINDQNRYSASNGNSRVILAAAAATGTHQSGTNYPNAQRLAVPLASLAGTYSIGINNADVPYLSIATGNWSAGTTWNKGVAPSCTDVVIIQTGHVVTVNSAANVSKTVTVNTGGTLSVASGDLTIGCTLNNNTLTINGTLLVSGGTLNMNGNIVSNSSSVFNQSGGNINIDGNAAGVAASSVASGTTILQFNQLNSGILLTGGTLTLVDPHANATATNTIGYSNGTSGPQLATTGHTTRFGDGVSTDAGGTTGGFKIDVYTSTAFLVFGNLEINGGTGTNRSVTNVWPIASVGNVTVNANSTLNISGGSSNSLYFAGNLDVKSTGTYITTGTTFAALCGNTPSSNPSTLPQSITSRGSIQNLAASPTAEFTSFTVNNSSTAGVTLGIPIRVSGTLTMTAGLINTTAANMLQLGTSTIAGTFSGTTSATNMIVGPFTRTFAASTTGVLAGTTTQIFPVGKGTTYQPIWLSPTTTAGGAVQFVAETFLAPNPGSAAGGVTNLSGATWSAIPSATTNITSVFVQIGDATIVAGKQILNASTPSGVYGSAVGGASFTAGTPNILKTNAAIPIASYRENFAHGDVMPCTAPTTQPTAFVSSLLTSTGFTGSFTAATSLPSNYLIVRYPTGAVVTPPVDFTTYAIGGALGLGTVRAISSATTFVETGLTAGTTYDYYVYSYSNSSCYGPVYFVTGPLVGMVATCAAATVAPGTPTLGSATTTTLVVNWTASTTVGVTYILDVATDAAFTTFVSGFNAANVGSAITATISGLSVGTNYFIRVRAALGPCYSAISATLATATNCNPVSLPYFEGFETITAVNTLPACMTVTPAIGGKTRTYNAAATGTNAALIAKTGSGFSAVNWSPSATRGYFFSAPITLTAGVLYKTSVFYRTDGVSWTDATLYYGTAATGAAMINTIATATNITTTTYTELNGLFSVPTTGDYYVAYSAFNATSAPNYIAFDDFKVELGPTTPPACVTTTVPANAATGVIRNSTLSWTLNPDASSYDVYFGTTSPAALVLSNFTGSTYTPPVMAANTLHYWKVVPKNINGGATMCTELTFTTGSTVAACLPAFTAGTTSGCRDGDVIAKVVLNTLVNDSGTGCPSGTSSLPGYSDYTGNSAFTTTLNAGTSYTCTVTAGEFTANYAAWVDYNSNGTFEPSERIGFTTTPVTGSGIAGTSGSSANFTISLACNPVPGTYILRIREGYGTTGSALQPCGLAEPASSFNSTYGEVEDYAITIAPPPPCPSPSALTSSPGLTPTSRILNWTTGCAEVLWDVHVQLATDMSVPTSTTTPSDASVTKPYTKSGLLSVTSYNYWVRAVCAAGSVYSAWVGPFTFTTPLPNDEPCTAELMILNGAEVGLNTSIATVSAAETSSNLPTIWTTSALNNTVYYKYTPTVTAAIKLTMSSPAASTQVMSTWCGIYTLTGCPSGTLAFTQVMAPVSGSATAGTPTVTVTPVLTAGIEYVFMIDGVAGSLGDFTIKIDENLLVPGCATLLTPADASTAVSLTTALTWSAPTTGGAVANYDVYFGTSSIALVATLPAGTTTYSPAGLLGSTTYSWYVVPKNAAGSAVGCAVPWTFTTGASTATLNVKAFIQGYYPGTGTVMVSALSNSAVMGATPTQCDNITVELHNATTSYGLAYTFTGVMGTDGTIACTYPGTAVGNSYYIVLKHRNSIETWSKDPVAITATVAYDFSDAAWKAYGDNQTQNGIMTAPWQIYSGDIDAVSGDGNIDLLDYPIWSTDNDNFESGYRQGDLNGDGNVDLLDYPVWSLNNDNFIYTIKP
jgi:GEVED domain